MEDQTDDLFNFRKGYEFDGLEKILHCATLQCVADRLYGKIAETKLKNANIDVSEHEKMVDILCKSIRWVNALYVKFEGKNGHIYDLHLLNKQLLARIEILETQIKTNEL